MENGSPDEGPVPPHSRRDVRVETTVQARLRREGFNSYQVRIFDISPHGCKVEFVDRPQIHERVWVKLDGLESLAALVCWIDGAAAGLEFEKSIHPAVFDLLLKRIGG